MAPPGHACGETFGSLVSFRCSSLAYDCGVCFFLIDNQYTEWYTVSMSEQKTSKREQQPTRHGGRVKSSIPEFLKKLRATEEERSKFSSLLTGDSRQDFLLLLSLLENQG